MPRLSLASAFVLVVIAVLAVGPAVAIEEPDRLWLVAEKAFGDFLQAWPEHRLVPSATFQLARALIDQKKYKDAIPLLAAFAKKYPGHNLVDESQYLLGWTKIRAGDPKGGVADLKAFVEAYPTSELVPDAKKLIT